MLINPTVHKLNCDIESYSATDIKRAGAWKYWEDPQAEVILFGYSLDGAPVRVVDLTADTLPPNIVDALKSPDVLLSGWNVSFEWLGCSKHLNYELPTSKLRDTMLSAAYCGFPLSLEAAGEAIGLGEDKKKITAGKALIRYFSVPCKPTKTNGGRTRNLPAHAPDKWLEYIAYNAGDVRAEMAIEDILSPWPVPDWLQEEWRLTLVQNNRGVGIDTELVTGALHCYEIAQQRLLAEAREITGLDNPNSVQQLSKWLSAEMGVPVDGLDKRSVGIYLDLVSNTEKSKRVLEIRQELGKSSVKKFHAMEDAACRDGRIRGVTQFYGAHTGRAAGRMIQTQNFPRSSVENEAMAREIVKAHDVEMLGMLYGSVPDTLSSLLRSALVPAPGNTMAACDLAAIEARVLAWVVGEEWVLDVFKTHGKIYETTASRLFKVPFDSIDKKSKYRQQGKVADLACIAEGQLVLTDKGLVPIEEITRNHLLWDGKQWVRHGGVIYKGTREVINYEGLTATTDHLVWVEGQCQPIHFGVAAACGAHLLQTGDGGRSIRACRNYQRRETVERGLEPLLCSNPLYNLRPRPLDNFRQSDARKIKRLSKLFATAKTLPKMVVQAVVRCKGALLQSKFSGVSQLRRPGDNLRFSVSGVGSEILGSHAWNPQPMLGHRPDRQRQRLRPGQSTLCHAESESRQPQSHRSPAVGTGEMALRANCCGAETQIRDDPRRNPCGCRESRSGETQKLARNKEKVRVYDILNSGPKHRFTVSNVLVHNCGYGGSVGAISAMDFNNEIQENDKPGLVARWREEHPMTVQFWWDVDNAIKDTIQKGHANVIRCVTTRLERSGTRTFLTIELPSGRKLFYPEPYIAEGNFNRPAIWYWGINQQTRKWEPIQTYGPRVVENIIQAIARDVIYTKITDTEKAEIPIVFSVHDEAVADVQTDDADALAHQMEDIMCTPIPWAADLPLGAEAWAGEWYRK